MELYFDSDNSYISICGKWNVDNSSKIVDEILFIVENNNLKKISLDFSKLDYIDSMGISDLIRLNSKLKEKFVLFSISKVPPIIKKILKLVRLELIIKIEEE